MAGAGAVNLDGRGFELAGEIPRGFAGGITAGFEDAVAVVVARDRVLDFGDTGAVGLGVETTIGFADEAALGFGDGITAGFEFAAAVVAGVLGFGETGIVGRAIETTFGFAEEGPLGFGDGMLTGFADPAGPGFTDARTISGCFEVAAPPLEARM